MDKAQILAAAQTEIRKHTWDFFVDNPPAIAQGGHGVVVPGCPACKVRLNTTGQFIEHLSRDVLRSIIDTALSRGFPS